MLVLHWVNFNYHFVCFADLIFTLRFLPPNPGSPESTLYVYSLPDNQLRIQSIKTEKPCFLVFENGQFKGGQPMDGNDLFEMVRVGPNSVALRVVNPKQGSGHSDKLSANSDCYLGFSDVTSEPTCYESTDFAATRFTIYH